MSSASIIAVQVLCLTDGDVTRVLIVGGCLPSAM